MLLKALLMNKFKYVSSNGIIVCQEQKCKLEFNCNKEVYLKTNSDDKSSSKPTCDFIICSEDKKTNVMFIELKGNDIKHACKQIISTYNDIDTPINNTYCAIVHSSTPKAITTLPKIKMDLKRKTKAKEIFIKNSLLKLKNIDNNISRS